MQSSLFMYNRKAHIYTRNTVYICANVVKRRESSEAKRIAGRFSPFYFIMIIHLLDRIILAYYMCYMYKGMMMTVVMVSLLSFGVLAFQWKIVLHSSKEGRYTYIWCSRMIYIQRGFLFSLLQKEKDQTSNWTNDLLRRCLIGSEMWLRIKKFSTK